MTVVGQQASTEIHGVIAPATEERRSRIDSTRCTVTAYLEANFDAALLARLALSRGDAGVDLDGILHLTKMSPTRKW
ncbi:MAG: hypothetical protein ACYTHK_03675 [Planctomycetota bacterium]